MRGRARALASIALTVAAAAFGWAPAAWGSAPLLAQAQAAPPPAGTATPAGRSPLDVTGATRIDYDDATQEWAFRGARVVVVRGNVRIESPEILYGEKTREVTLPRGGAVLTPTVEVTADRIITQLQRRHITAEGHVAGRFTDEEEPSSGGSTPQKRWGTFAAERVDLDDRPDARQIVATGQVVIVREDRRLRGDRVVYNHLTQQGTVQGHAELVGGSDRLRAEHIFADMKRREAQADDHVLLDHKDIHGSGDHAAYSEPAQTAMLTGHVVLHRGRDTLTADRATVLLDRDTAIAEGHVQLVAYSGESAP